jgi:hypothetical protein
VEIFGGPGVHTLKAYFHFMTSVRSKQLKIFGMPTFLRRDVRQLKGKGFYLS